MDHDDIEWDGSGFIYDDEPFDADDDSGDNIPRHVDRNEVVNIEYDEPFNLDY